jgi:hypothetical protein
MERIDAWLAIAGPLPAKGYYVQSLYLGNVPCVNPAFTPEFNPLRCAKFVLPTRPLQANRGA